MHKKAYKEVSLKTKQYTVFCKRKYAIYVSNAVLTDQVAITKNKE